jgi:transcription antitermination factor NusG
MTPGVTSIIGQGRQPEPIPGEEITRIQASCASGLQVAPWPYLERGDMVRVECGPLQGVEGIFISEKNTCRLVISVEILRRSVAVELDRDWVRPVGTQRASAHSTEKALGPVCSLSPVTPLTTSAA